MGTGKLALILKLALLALLLAPALATAAKLYKWTDAEGNVHYSDKVPPEHSKSARSELDDRGIQVNQVDAAKTKEQIEREQELQRLRAEQQRLIEEQKAKDRVLLRTFRTEDDILMARNGKLTAVDVLIQVSRSNIRRMKFKLAEMQQNAAQSERQGRSVSDTMLKNIESTRQQLKDGYAAIIHMEQNKELIREKAALDIDRFRKLKQLSEENTAQLDEEKPFSLLDTVVVCDDKVSCNNAWEKAEDYVREHATTRLQILSDSIIMTAAPANDDDISLTVSRIIEEGFAGAKLFMDLQCKDSPRGDDLCKSPTMEEIRMGFRSYLGYQQSN
ncbi:MAG: DUF4124 domain-containing protein [Sedimenticola sp.]|nr:MAG: DUF4124 domain-containing protein [Sedimenticola sp.]